MTLKILPTWSSMMSVLTMLASSCSAAFWLGDAVERAGGCCRMSRGKVSSCPHSKLQAGRFDWEAYVREASARWVFASTSLAS